MKISSEAKQAALLSALANEKRILILKCILDREVPVGELAELVGLSQSALSQHLAKLRILGLVSTRRDAQMIYYSSKNESVRKVFDTLADIFDGQSLEMKRAG